MATSTVNRDTFKLGKLLAEFIGTFSLAYAVLASVNGVLAPAVPTGVIAGVTLALTALSVGAISGAHINPAITVGLLSIKQISFKQAVGYIVAQFAGAFSALGLFTMLKYGHAASVKSGGSNWHVFFAEMLGAVIFSFGVSAAIEQGFDKLDGAVLVGGSLLLGIIFAGAVSNGVLNPAVAFSIKSATWAYLLAPFAGSIVGMNVQHYIRKSVKS